LKGPDRVQGVIQAAYLVQKTLHSMQHHKQRYFIQGTSEWQGNGAVHHSSENWSNLLRFLPNCYRFDLVVTENRKKIFWGLRKIAKNN
jgi:hypothetical protein